MIIQWRRITISLKTGLEKTIKKTNITGYQTTLFNPFKA